MSDHSILDVNGLTDTKAPVRLAGVCFGCGRTKVLNHLSYSSKIHYCSDSCRVNREVELYGD